MFNIYNLKFRMVAAMGLLLLIALLFDFLYLVPTIESHDFEQARASQAALAGQIAASVDFEFSQGIAEIEALAKHPDIVSMEKDRLDRTLAEFDRVTQFFNNYFVLDTTGQWISFPGNPPLVGRRIPDHNMGWVKKTFGQDRTVFLDVVKTLVGTLVSGFSTPIHSETGEQVGLLRGVIITSKENTVLSTILDTRVGRNGYAYIVSANGWLIAHPGVEQSFDNFTVYDYSGYLPVQRALEGETGVAEYEYEGQTWVAAYQPIRSTNWGIVVQQPSTDIVKSVREETSLYVFIAGSIFVLAILMIPLMLTYAMRPLSRLVASIRNREFTEEAMFTRDEIGQLAGEFSTMYAELVRSEENLKRLNEELEEHVAERTGHLIQAREELRKREKHYRELFEHSKDGIILHDREERIIDVNYQALALFRYDKEEMLSLTIADLHPEEARGRLRDEIRGISCNTQFHHEADFLRKDGSLFSAEISSSPIETGSEPIILCQVRDITERRRLEDQLRHSQKMEAIGTLTAGVAHEFNNIMTSILGFAELLEEDLSQDRKLKEYSSRIVYSAHRAAKLTDGMLAYTRKKITKFDNLDLNDVLNDVQEFLISLVGERIELIIETCPEPLPVLADRSHLEQVVLNLTTNAIDAMPEGGTLRISGQSTVLDGSAKQHTVQAPPGEYAVITATDSGTGMDEATREKIFEPFFTTKEVGRGTGLGLSTVYGIVKKHGGYIDLASEPGRGTSFYIYLPLSAAGAGNEPDAGPIPVEAAALRGTETILVAEDDESVSDIISTTLANAGYTVITAPNGKEAVRSFGAHSGGIDLLIFDIAMPKLDGKGAYDKILLLSGGTPKVLFISGYIHESSRRIEIIQEGHPFLQKPISPRELLEKVREVLDARQGDSSL